MHTTAKWDGTLNASREINVKRFIVVTLLVLKIRNFLFNTELNNFFKNFKRPLNLNTQFNTKIWNIDIFTEGADY